MKKIIIINGPNLNLLGSREPKIYGNKTFKNYIAQLREKYKSLQIDYFQSNVEGLLIDSIQGAELTHEGIILNAAAYTHTSVGIGDAIKAITIPVVEVHISNTFGREPYRHQSYISAHTRGVILGFGLQSYELAIQSFSLEN